MKAEIAEYCRRLRLGKNIALISDQIELKVIRSTCSRCSGGAGLPGDQKEEPLN